MGEAKKRCPECGEEILAVARKCKHCGSVLDSPAAAAGGPLRPSPSAAVDKPAADFGIAILAVPLAATMLIVFWVGSMNLLQGPASTLGVLGIGTILTTAGLIAWEASRLGTVSDRKKGTYSPLSWLVLTLLLWVVGYPAYLFKRRHYGLRNLLVPGLVVTVLFVGSWSLMASAIDEHVTKLQSQLSGTAEELEQLGKERPRTANPKAAAQGWAGPGAKAALLELQQTAYLHACQERRKSLGVELGGESKEEARQAARELCTTAPPEFIECMDAGKLVPECFRATLAEDAD